ncbi:MAG: hypothetical protein QM817_41180 [Archangium sp.]
MDDAEQQLLATGTCTQRDRELCREAQQRLVRVAASLVIRRRGAEPRTAIVHDDEVIDFGGFTARVLISNESTGASIRVESVTRDDLESSARGHPSKRVRIASEFALPNEFVSQTEERITVDVPRGHFERPDPNAARKRSELLRMAPVSGTELATSIQAAIAVGQRELLEDGWCVERVLAKCGDDYVIHQRTAWSTTSLYFDASGARIGHRSSSCTDDEFDGTVRDCGAPLVLESLCDRSAAQVVREDATIFIDGIAFKVDPGNTTISVGDLEIFVGVDRLATRPVSIRVTKQPDGARDVRVGDELEIPTELSIGGRQVSIRSRSRFRSTLTPTLSLAGEGDFVVKE